MTVILDPNNTEVVLYCYWKDNNDFNECVEISEIQKIIQKHRPQK